MGRSCAQRSQTPTASHARGSDAHRQGTTRDRRMGHEEGRVGCVRRRGGGGAVTSRPRWRTAPGSGRPPSSASATRRSRARPAAGRATPTARRQNVDALGSTAYYDAGERARRSTAAIAPRRRRSASPSAATWRSANLACSGARTYTQPFSSGSDFKPGLDFYDDGAGHIGQARALQQYAATHNVKMVVALIGANDYGFADIVQQCVTDWLTSPSWWKNYCHDDSSMTSKFTAANVAAITTRVANAFLNLRTAMRNAGYADGSWTLLAQTYSSPLPRGAQIRYSQNGFTRQTVGGCGVWNADADWANDTVVAKLNGTVRNAAAAAGMIEHRAVRGAERARRPPPVREHRRPARGAGARELALGRRGRPLGVGLADPHDDDAVRPLPAPGGRAPVLLGPAGAAQLPAPGLQRRRPARRAPAAARRPGSTRQGEPNMSFG